MAGMDNADGILVMIQCIEKMVQLDSRQGEYRIIAVLLNRFGKRFGAGHICHAGSPGLNSCG